MHIILFPEEKEKFSINHFVVLHAIVLANHATMWRTWRH